MEWEDWIQEVYNIAYNVDFRIAVQVQEYTFMYEEYFEQGMTPHEAFQEEWG